MGIFDRLGDVLKSYLNDEDDRLFGKRSRRTGSGTGPRYDDPDLQEAFEELDDFLEGKERTAGGFYREQAAQSGRAEDSGNGRAPSGDAGRASSGGTGRASSGNSAGRRPAGDVPESLRQDFVELGVPFGASADECKAAYKKLLKLHHPDRHAGHAGNMKKATEKSARINAAFDKILRWRETGRTD
jgi:DnaJ-domain-containing protein 1